LFLGFAASLPRCLAALQPPLPRCFLGASRSHRVAWRSFRNPNKIAPESLLGPPGAHVGPSWGSFWASRGSCWPSWGSFWASRSSLWSSWGPPGAPGSLPEAPWEVQNGSKIAPGGPPGGLPDRSSIFEAFSEQLWLHFWTPRSSKIELSPARRAIFQKIARFEKNSHFGAILGPKRPPPLAQNPTYI